MLPLQFVSCTEALCFLKFVELDDEFPSDKTTWRNEDLFRGQAVPNQLKHVRKVQQDMHKSLEIRWMRKEWLQVFGIQIRTKLSHHCLMYSRTIRDEADSSGTGLVDFLQGHPHQIGSF